MRSQLLVLERERRRDLLAQDAAVEQVLDADADPRRLVGVRRPDAALGGADLRAARAAPRTARRACRCHGITRCALPEMRRPSSDARASPGRRAPRTAPSGSITTPLPSTQSLPGSRMPEGSSWKLERLVADDDRVAGVVAALVAGDDVEPLGQQVDDLALALVAPLGADDDGAGHITPPRGRGRRTACTARGTRARPSRSAPLRCLETMSSAMPFFSDPRGCSTRRGR